MNETKRLEIVEFLQANIVNKSAEIRLLCYRIIGRLLIKAFQEGDYTTELYMIHVLETNF